MESISEFIEKYVSVSDIVTTLITMAIAGVFTLILRAIWKGIKKLSKAVVPDRPARQRYAG